MQRENFKIDTVKLVKLSNRQFNKVASVEAMLKVSADTRTAIVTKKLIVPPYGLPAFKCDSICFVHDWFKEYLDIFDKCARDLQRGGRVGSQLWLIRC